MSALTDEIAPVAQLQPTPSPPLITFSLRDVSYAVRDESSFNHEPRNYANELGTSLREPIWRWMKQTIEQPDNSGNPSQHRSSDEPSSVCHVLQNISLEFPHSIAHSFQSSSSAHHNEVAFEPTRAFYQRMCPASASQTSAPISPPNTGYGMCVIGPPGCGAASLLRVMAAQIHPSLPALANHVQWSGQECHWNGLSFKEANAHGIEIRKMVRLAETEAEHPLFLHPREVLQTALRLSVSQANLPAEEKRAFILEAVQATLDLLDLTEVADSKVASALSPLQGRRLTIAECLVAPAFAYLLDRIDQYLTPTQLRRILRALQKWSIRTGGVFVISLQNAPDSDVWQFFQSAILMDGEGRKAFEGSIDDLQMTFRSPAAAAKSEGNNNEDKLEEASLSNNFNDLAVLLSSRVRTWLIKQEMGEVVAPGDILDEGGSSHFIVQVASVPSVEDKHAIGFNSAASTLFPSHNSWRPSHFGPLIRREALLVFRNRPFWIWALFTASLMGVILSTLFIRMTASFEDAPFRFGLAFYTALFISFANLAELPLAATHKRSAFKLLQRGAVTPGQYVCAVSLCGLVVPFVQTVILATLDYWITNFSANAGRYVYFLFVLIISSWSLALLFRALAYTIQRTDKAQLVMTALMVVMLLFGGFLITSQDMPAWMRYSFFWFASPFAWIMRATIVNEFHDVRYSEPATPTEVNNGDEGSAAVRGDAVGGQTSMGDTYLALFQVSPDESFRFAVIGYLGAVALFALSLAVLMLTFRRFSLMQGERRHQRNYMRHKTVENDVKVILSEVSSSFSSLIPTSSPRSGLSLILPKSGGADVRCERGTLTAVVIQDAPKQMQWIKEVRKELTSNDTDVSLEKHSTWLTLPTESIPRRVSICDTLETRDHLFAPLTCSETLQFAARLHATNESTEQEVARLKCVEPLLQALDLAHENMKQLPIGDVNHNGITDSQRGRLYLALELLCAPSALFVSLPVSVQSCGALDRTYRTLHLYSRMVGIPIVVACSRLDPDNARLFDNVYEERGSSTMIQEKENDVEKQLLDMKEPGPIFYRAFSSSEAEEDLYPKLENVNAVIRTTENSRIGDHELYGLYTIDEDEYPTKIAPETATASFAANRTVDSNRPRTIGGLRHFSIVLQRIFLGSWREVVYHVMRTWVSFVISISFGLTYLQLHQTNEIRVEEAMFGMYIVGGFGAILHATGSLPVHLRWREVARKDIEEYGLYSSWEYVGAVLLQHLPWLIFITFLLLTPFYFLAGFPADAVRFFETYAAILCLCVFFVSWSFFLSMAVTPHPLATSILAFSFNILLLFGGIFQSQDRVPQGWKWLWYISPVNKYTTAVWIALFQCEGASYDIVPRSQLDALIATSNGCSIIPVFGQKGTEYETVAASVSDFAGVLRLNDHYLALHFGWMIISSAVCIIGAFVAARIRFGKPGHLSVSK